MPTNVNTATYTDNALIKSSSALSRKVIINVDDLGLSEPVNEAVVNLAQKRLITASSYMVGGQIDSKSIELLEMFHIDIGLHLDFTGLFNTTLPNTLPKLLKTSYLRQIDKNQVTNEIKQQLDMFEDIFNHAPRFVDGHQHIHQFPIIRECLISELSKRYDKKLNHTIAARVTTPINYDLKAWIIYTLGGKKWRKLCQDASISTNTHFGGVYDFEANAEKLSTLWSQWLSQCPMGLSGFDIDSKRSPVSVIMCHPAVPSNSWDDDIKKAREHEYEWMNCGALKALYNKYSIELIHWRDIYNL